MIQLQTYIFICLIVSIICCCNGFKIYFEHEDMWEEQEEALREAKYQKIQWIFPGTKWCGTGNIAQNENDLGSAFETDMCCRAHDLCNDVIEAGQTKHNLTNNSFYTKLNCKCDERFYDCLKSSSMKSAKAVGHIYFNVLGTQCYRYDYPIVKCLEYHKHIQNRCIEYELNTNAPKVWEWFDVPPY